MGVVLDEPSRAFVRILDELGVPLLLLLGPDGRELHRTRRLGRVLAKEPEAERVVRAMGALADSLLRRKRRSAVRESPPQMVREISTTGFRYRLQPAVLGPEAGVRWEGIAVALEPLSLELPPEPWLRRRYGLTVRQAEVTLRLARGDSNREIADRLFISPHTVRTHAQHIFRKLSIRSRKALALRLVRDWRPSGRGAREPAASDRSRASSLDHPPGCW